MNIDDKVRIRMGQSQIPVSARFFGEGVVVQVCADLQYPVAVQWTGVTGPYYYAPDELVIVPDLAVLNAAAERGEI